MCENHEPKPVDELPPPEIRGGNRESDYLFNAEQTRTPSKETALIQEDENDGTYDDPDAE